MSDPYTDVAHSCYVLLIIITTQERITLIILLVSCGEYEGASHNLAGFKVVSFADH